MTSNEEVLEYYDGVLLSRIKVDDKYYILKMKCEGNLYLESVVRNSSMNKYMDKKIDLLKLIKSGVKWYLSNDKRVIKSISSFDEIDKGLLPDSGFYNNDIGIG